MAAECPPEERPLTERELLVQQLNCCGPWLTEPEIEPSPMPAEVVIDPPVMGVQRPPLRTAMHKADMAAIADTLDLDSLQFHNLQGAMLTPQNILEQIHHDDIFYHVWVAVRRVLGEIDVRKYDWATVEFIRVSDLVMEQFLIELSLAVWDRVQGPLIIFTDPRFHDYEHIMEKNVSSLIGAFEKRGISRDKLIVSIPATDKGMVVAHILETKQGIRTNMIHVSGLLHAIACAEAGATSITMPIGPIMRAMEEMQGLLWPDMRQHPGIQEIQTTAMYFKMHGIKTQLIGTNLRELTDIRPMKGLQGLALTAAQLDSAHHSRMLVYETPHDSSPVSVRAKDAKYPGGLFSRKKRFSLVIPASTRSTLAATTCVCLGKMKDDMDRLFYIVRQELKRQVDLELVDLSKVYFRGDGSTPHNEAPRRSSSGRKRSKSRSSESRHAL